MEAESSDRLSLTKGTIWPTNALDVPHRSDDDADVAAGLRGALRLAQGSTENATAD